MKRGNSMSENKKFTGFKFIDEKLGGLLPSKLCCIGGENDPLSAETLCLSILKGIMDKNSDGVIAFINSDEFIILNCNLADFAEENKFRSKTLIELSKRLPLQRIKFVMDSYMVEKYGLKDAILNRTKDQKLLAIFIADLEKNDVALKSLAEELQVPVIAYDRRYINDETERLIVRHMEADIVIRCNVTSDGKSSEMICYTKDFEGIYKGKTNQKGTLQEVMDWELPEDKNKLWFYYDE